MKNFDWDREKNEILMDTRDISFEEIVFHIENDGELDVYPHPNQERYPNQLVSVVVVNDYAYLASYVESKDSIFLKALYGFQTDRRGRRSVAL